MAWVGYRGPDRVATKFGKTFWNMLTDDGEIDPVYFVEVTVESEIEWFKKEQYFEVKESLKEKVARKTRKPVKPKKSKPRSVSDTDISAAPRSRTQPSRPTDV